MVLVEPKRAECMTELGMEDNNPHAGLSCEQLRNKIVSEYDMCSDSFEWPESGKSSTVLAH